MQNTKQKETTRDDEYDEDHFFKSINDHVCKPLGSGFEDLFLCQSNLQDMQLRHKKQLEDLELKVDNTRAQNTESNNNQNDRADGKHTNAMK